MDYAALYQQKLTTADEAVKLVKSGDWVDYGWCTNHPYTLDKALAKRVDELMDVKFRGGVTLWMPAVAEAETARAWIARSSRRGRASSRPCATASCRASTATATPTWTSP